MGQQLYQSRLGNASDYVKGISMPETAAAGSFTGAITTPSKGFDYVDRGAGQERQNAAISNYENEIKAAQMQGNPWSNAINILTGATKLVGSIAGGPIGMGLSAASSLASASGLSGKY